MPRLFVAWILVSGLLLAACDGGTSEGEEEGLRTFTLRLSDAEPLPGGFHYEAWALIGSTAGAANVSIGKFNLDADGDLVDLGGSPIPNSSFTTDFDLERAAAFFITIEPPGDTDQTPAATRLLGGDPANDEAELLPNHRSALDAPLFLASGTFILTTPTNGPDTDENSGLWFANLTTGLLARGLDVPTLPAGWTYEGWVFIDGVPVSTGTFENPSGPDAAAPYSGPMPGLDFPGEDFLVNAPPGLSFPTFLAGSLVTVTIEPEPDTEPAPFMLRLLSAPIPGNARPDTTFSLANNAAAFPSASVRLR